MKANESDLIYLISAYILSIYSIACCILIKLEDKTMLERLSDAGTTAVTILH